MSKILRLAAIASAGFMLAAGLAQATPVPAGTLGLSTFTHSTVDNSAFTVALPSSIGYGGGGGQFATSSGNATVYSSPFAFSSAVGGMISYTGGASITSFLTFLGGDGDTYTYSLDNSIQTISYSYNAGLGNGTVDLYLLGDLTGAGPTPYTNPTPTALTLTLNETGNSGYTFSATLANPPPGSGVAPVPEPASIALLGGGLAIMGFIRRRRAAQ